MSVPAISLNDQLAKATSNFCAGCRRKMYRKRQRSLGGHGLGDEVLLLPASLLVLGVHVLVLPHRVQNLTAANTAQFTQTPVNKHQLFRE